jgi:transposase
MAAPRKYPVELQERAVRRWRSEQPRRPIAHLARELGVHPEAVGELDPPGRGRRRRAS